MDFTIAHWTVLFITIAFGVLTILLLIQAIIRKRYAWSFFLSIIFGFMAGVAAIFNELVFTDNAFLTSFLRSLHLNLYGFHFFCFYIFFERLISRKVNSLRLSIMIILITMQTLGLFLVFYNEVNSLDAKMAWVLADIGYWSPALFTYIGLGVPIYIKTYKYTKEIKPIILCFGLIFVGVGFFISFLNDLEYIFSVFEIYLNFPSIIAELSEIANVFPLIGILLFVIVYLVNIDYIYRLPNDTFTLLVLKRGGIPVHSVHLKTRKKTTIKEFLLSGMITAIDNVFREIMDEELPIERITSQGINILIKSGQTLSVVVITDKITYFLDKGLQRYINEFEKKYADEIKRDEENMHAYDGALKILKQVFPFFIIKE